jgi:hypothetical protein
VDWQLVRSVRGGLGIGQILILAVVNLGIVLLLGARWWLILRALEKRGIAPPIKRRQSPERHAREC